MAFKPTGKRTAALALILLCLFLCCPFLTPSAAAAEATGPRVVRVGIPDSGYAQTPEGTNRMIAFEKDYFQALAQYVNWQLIYVNGTWSECMEMLKAGEIDLLPYASKTDERELYYGFSSESMGTEMCYLFGRSDTDLPYDDFFSFDGMTVGYEAGTTVLDSLRAYANEKGFSFQAKAYPNGGAMFAALDRGEVDTVVQTNFFDSPDGHVILAKCSPTPIYLITSKNDTTLKAQLDSALAQLFSYYPSFNADLFEYHFTGSVTQNMGYTKKEAAYLASKPVVNVFYETSWEPFEYTSRGEAAGITPDIIRAIGEETGITFRFVLSPSTADVYDSVNSAASDTVMAVSYDYAWANNHQLLMTQPYVTSSTMRVTKNVGAPIAIVATVKDTYMERQVQKNHPEWITISYPTYGACMDAIVRSQVDCTFLNYYQTNFYRSMRAYADFSYQPDENISQGISLGVTKDSNPALFAVLSKSLQRMSSHTVQGILSDNATQMGDPSFGMLLRRYPIQMAIATALLVSLLGLLTIMLIASGVRKRQNIHLAAAKRDAEEASRAKSDFLSRMSHDMRTPLNGIIGMTYLTEQMELPSDARANLQKIDTSSKFLLSLINDLLDMSKAESGKIQLHPEPYPPEDFRQYIDAVIRPLCQSKGQSLTADISAQEELVPLLDKLRINQIIFNLLSNAVKYTPEGGAITYAARARRLPSGRMAVRLEVADNGIGMSESFQKLLFTPFSQENRNDNSEFRGSGLGLAITKQLVDLMGGTITVESAIRQGTRIKMELETDGVERQAVKKTGAAPAGEVSMLAGKHILLCEDHPLNQEIARTLLCEKQMTVEIAEDGQRGVYAFAHSPIGYYDVVLMDIRMPVMDGFAASRGIRSLPRKDAKTVPILAMSADVFSDDIQKCLSFGMNGHVPKPIEPAVLYRALLAAIGTDGQDIL